MKILISSFYPRSFVATPRCSASLVPIKITTRRRKKKANKNQRESHAHFLWWVQRRLVGTKNFWTFLSGSVVVVVVAHKFLAVAAGPTVPWHISQTSHNLQQHVQYDREHLQEHPTSRCYRIDSIIVLRYLLSPTILFIVLFHLPIVGPLLLVICLLYRNSWLCLNCPSSAYF